MGRSAKKIDSDRPLRRAIEEAQHRAFLPKLLKTQLLRQKLRRMLKPFDLNLDGSNPPNGSGGWPFPASSIRACFGGLLDKSQVQTIRIPEAQTLLSERPSVADHVGASLRQAVTPTLQCPGRHREDNGAYVTGPAQTGRLGFVNEECDHRARSAAAVSEIEVQHRWLVEIHRLPDEMKPKDASVKLLRPLRIGSDRGDVVNASDCRQSWLAFHQRWLGCPSKV
jgi:hypothetical protein